MKYSTKITYKIHDHDPKKHEDTEWQNLADSIYNKMLQTCTESIQKGVVKYNRILRGCHIDFIFDVKKLNIENHEPIINIIYIPERKIKIVRLVLNIIQESKEEEFVIERQKKFN